MSPQNLSRVSPRCTACPTKKPGSATPAVPSLCPNLFCALCGRGGLRVSKGSLLRASVPRVGKKRDALANRRRVNRRFRVHVYTRRKAAENLKGQL